MFLGILLIALTWGPASAADESSVENLAAAGKLNEAIAAARELPSQDAAYFYNLGTLLLRAGQLGPSVAYLEKARELNPIDPAISKNLNAGRASLSQILGESRLDPASNLLERCSSLFPMRTVQALLGLALAMSAWALVRRGGGRIFALSLFLFVSVSALRAGWGIEAPAMVLESQIIRSGPGNQFLDLGRAEAGVKLRASGETLIESLPDKPQLWSQVRYSADGIGWVKTSALLLL